jgi:hypothetical protein
MDISNISQILMDPIKWLLNSKYKLKKNQKMPCILFIIFFLKKNI